jgi:hypothetical protein
VYEGIGGASQHSEWIRIIFRLVTWTRSTEVKSGFNCHLASVCINECVSISFNFNKLLLLCFGTFVILGVIRLLLVCFGKFDSCPLV